MNEKTMIWFLQKTKKYELSSDAMSLWMDFYTYLQNQSRACNPQIPFSLLQQICDLERETLRTACEELQYAGMLQFLYEKGQVICRLTAGKLYCPPRMTAV